MIVDVPGSDHIRAYRETWIGVEHRDIRAYKRSSQYHETGFLGDSQSGPPLTVRVALWHHRPLHFGGLTLIDRAERGFGFPLVCLFWWYDNDHGSHGAVAVPPWTGLRHGTSFAQLPYLPIWPGLIANTVFWGGVWWCALFVPAMVRKRRRIKRGQCPACGYDLSANPAGTPCPECGGSNT